MSTRRSKSLQTRFLAKVVQGPDCWEWGGFRNHHGYGELRGQRGKPKRVRAHRVSWEVHFGPIPDGMLVCHTCDNRACVRPSHLFLGTVADNSADMVAKGRSLTGLRNPQRVLGPDAVRAIRLADGPIRSIATKHGVSYALVSKIRRGEIWKGVA